MYYADKKTKSHFIRENVKKLAFLADAPFKAFTPPPSRADFMQVFFYMYTYIYIYMFLKQEKPAMDDFERKRKFGYKWKNTKLFKKKSF